MGLFSRIFIAIIVIVAVPYYWLLLDARTGSVPARPIDIAAIRKLADQLPGQRPVSIEYAPLAVRRMPGTLLVAGGGLQTHTVAKVAYRLVTPGGDTVIDVGPTRAQAADVNFDQFDDLARSAVDRWMRDAKRILFTHEHPDFVGAFIASDAFDSLAPKVTVSRRQADVMERMRSGVASGGTQIVSSDQAEAIAPGIVFIPAPGHSVGSQFIYVKLASGREYLFVGDTATMQRNVSWIRPRSRLASSWQGGEDRDAVIGHLKGLEQLATAAPGVTIVYGGDVSWLQTRRGGPGFTSAFRYGSQDSSESNEETEQSSLK